MRSLLARFGNSRKETCRKLSAVVTGHPTDGRRIERLFELFAAALDRLCAIGAASEDGPGREL